MASLSDVAPIRKVRKVRKINIMDILPNTITDSIIRQRSFNNYDNLYELNVETRWSILDLIKINKINPELDSRQIIFGKYSDRQVRVKYVELDDRLTDIAAMFDGYWGITNKGKLFYFDKKLVQYDRSIDGVKFIKVKSSSSHLLALTDLGNVYVFGSNDHGQLLVGQSGMFAKVKKVTLIDQSMFNNEKIVDIAAAMYQSLFLSESGNIYLAGSSRLSQPGSNAITLINSDYFIDPVTSIHAGTGISVALTTNGYVYIWKGDYGDHPQLVSSQLFNNQIIVHASIGDYQIILLTSTGQAYNMSIKDENYTINIFETKLLVATNPFTKFRYSYSYGNAAFLIDNDDVVYALGTDRNGLFGQPPITVPVFDPPFHGRGKITYNEPTVISFGNPDENYNIRKIVSTSSYAVALKW